MMFQTVFVIFSTIVNFIRGLVVDTMGAKYVKLAPAILFFFAYVFTANMVSLFGFKEATTASSVPLSMALSSCLRTNRCDPLPKSIILLEALLKSKRVPNYD